jgi:hypothetical protein
VLPGIETVVQISTHLPRRLHDRMNSDRMRRRTSRKLIWQHGELKRARRLKFLFKPL